MLTGTNCCTVNEKQKNFFSESLQQDKEGVKQIAESRGCIQVTHGDVW